jgi:L-alanine-DL-glutamate epimerase-like enolase superfamily enzyme
LETVRLAEHPNILWVQLQDEDGLVGLGETYFMPEAVESYLHEVVAPLLIGRDPLAIDAIARDLVGYLGFRSSGIETRGNSAVDIALWDMFGKAMGQPIAQLLGGFTRETIRTYNTCAGPAYMRGTGGQRSANWGVGETPHSLDDLHGFLNRPGELARELLDEGISAMKIWPFDLAAEASQGQHIDAESLRRALVPFEAIRAEVGDAMDIMVEFHSLWRLTPAIRIARALAPFDTYWHEDPIRMDSLSSLRRYAAASRAPVCASETLAGRAAFRDLLETDAVGVVMLDLSWCGGISEARKIAAMAEAWQLSVAPHDCTGPVTLCASTHLGLNAPNALIQESVRAYHRGWYREVVTALPPIEGGRIGVPKGPGLGLELMPDLDRRFTVHRRVSGKERVR